MDALQTVGKLLKIYRWPSCRIFHDSNFVLGVSPEQLWRQLMLTGDHVVRYFALKRLTELGYFSPVS